MDSLYVKKYLEIEPLLSLQYIHGVIVVIIILLIMFEMVLMNFNDGLNVFEV